MGNQIGAVVVTGDTAAADELDNSGLGFSTGSVVGELPILVANPPGSFGIRLELSKYLLLAVLADVEPDLHDQRTTFDVDVVSLSLQERFMSYTKVCFIAGLLLASPVVACQLWKFVAEGWIVGVTKIPTGQSIRNSKPPTLSMGRSRI